LARSTVIGVDQIACPLAIVTIFAMVHNILVKSQESAASI
jgi:hypothetical protein